MADSDLMQLYSRRILALTTAIPHLGALPAFDGKAMRRSPQCGSSVTAYVAMDGDRIDKRCGPARLAKPRPRSSGRQLSGAAGRKLPPLAMPCGRC